ncbi:MAG: hypothetical protein ACW99A_23345, partial [Candidatus Kariarchaeaceae archaeon]
MSSVSEDAVDNNISNIDGSPDIGTENNFPNVQNTTLDNRSLTVQEEDTYVAEVNIDSITSYSGEGESFSFFHTVSGTNRLLIVSIQSEGKKIPKSVTYAGQLLTPEVDSDGGSPNIVVWSLINPQTGLNNVFVAFESGESDKVAIGVISYTGVNQTNPIDGITSIRGKAGGSALIVASEPGDLVQDAVAALSNGPPTPGPSQTLLWNEEMGGSSKYGAGSIIPGDISVTTGWSFNGIAEFSHVAFNINKAIDSNYELDLEYQWTSADFTKSEEILAIYSSNLGNESLRVDVWSGSAWISIIPSLSANTWTNVSISNYLISSIFTIRLKGTIETYDSIQNQWDLDTMLIRTANINHPPSVSNLTFTPDPLYSFNTLTLSYDFYDEDSDSEDGTQIRWYKNSVLQPTFNDLLQIPAFNLFKYDIWFATVRPKDGQEFGTEVFAQPISVQNSLPLASNVYISPSNPTTKSDLSVFYDWSDPDTTDSDSNSIIHWYRDNGTGFNLESNFDNHSILPSNSTIKGESWYFTILPSDGDDYGVLNTSAVLNVVNIPPSLSNLTINDFNETNMISINENLVVNYTYFDWDNLENSSTDNPDINSREILWYRNGTIQPSLNNSLVIQFGNTSNGDVWQFQIRISDGYNYSNWYWSPSMWIDIAPNNPPEASNVNLNQSAAINGGFLYVDYNYFDLDGNNEAQSIYNWFKNDVYQPEYDNQRNLTNVQLIKGDYWYVGILPYDGYDYGSWNYSSPILIGNTAPEVISVQTFPTAIA